MSKKGRDRQLAHQRQQITAQRRLEIFQGPLPSPDVLIRYNDAVPNGAERILVMAEGQATHRQGLERAVVNGNIRAQARAQRYGLVIILAVVAVGAWLMSQGKDGYGFGTILAGLASLVGVFMWGRYRQERERREKAEQFQGSPVG
jgi:uncharacterized membrane protein